MHTHPNKYICIEKLNGTLYNSSVWADEKEVMQENFKKPVLLYQIKTLAKSGKVIRTSPIGYASAGVLKDRLVHQLYHTPEFPMNAERTLLKKTTKGNTVSSLYVLPVEDKANQPIGGFLFRQITHDNYPVTQFIGSVSLKDYKILKAKGLSPDKEESVQNFTAPVFPVMPQTTVPFADVHFVSQQKPKENIACSLSVQVKNEEQRFIERLNRTKALERF